MLLLSAPFLIAAAGLPIGDIAFGNVDAELVESADDFGIREVVEEHAVDQVALEFGQAGDFAIAYAGRRNRDAGG